MSSRSNEENSKKKLKDFLSQYVNEKDRTAIILVAAKLDYLLGQAIAAKLLPCTSATDELLDGDRALGTFSSRIHAAHRLGIIDDSFAKALHIFRRMRNDFAHRDRLHELIRPLIGGEFYKTIRSIFQDKKESEERINFIIASALLIGSLETAPDNVVSISDVAAISFRQKNIMT